LYIDALNDAGRCCPDCNPDPPIARIYWEILGECNVRFYANYNGTGGNFLSSWTEPATFYWDFGDGTTASTSVPFVDHQYPKNYGMDMYVKENSPSSITIHVNLLRRYIASLVIVDPIGVAAAITPRLTAGPAVLDRQRNPLVAPFSGTSVVHHLGGATKMEVQGWPTFSGGGTTTLQVNEDVGQTTTGNPANLPATPSITSEVIDFGVTTNETITPLPAFVTADDQWSSGGRGTDNPDSCPNDTFASREVLPSRAAGALGRSLRGATLDGPNNAGFYAAATDRDIWFEWVAPQNGTVRFSTVDTPSALSATMLGVYTGSALGSLSLVVFNDRGGTFGLTDLAIATFTAVAGTSYKIQVGCGYGQQGAVALKWSYI
jgi:hypothetical protein